MPFPFRGLVNVSCRRGFLLLLGGAVLSSCTSASQQASLSPLATVVARPLPSPEMSQSLSFDAPNRTATLTTVANVPGTPNELNYNGYSKARAVVRLPTGWSVRLHPT